MVGPNATISGAAVTVDSTYSTAIDPTTALSGAISLSSGQISLLLDNSVSRSALSSSLVLTPETLTDFQKNATTLSLMSYSSIDTYGAGTVGSSGLAHLALNAGEIRAFRLAPIARESKPDQTGWCNFWRRPSRSKIPRMALVSARSPDLLRAGTVDIGAGTIDLGANAVSIDQFAAVDLVATGGLLFQGSGSLDVAGSLAVTAPVITGAALANETITASRAVALNATSSAAATITPGLGASLSLTGASVAVGSEIELPSGTLTLEATGIAAGNVTVSGSLELGGTMQTFDDVAAYTDGGQVQLISNNGNVTVAPGGYVDVSAQAGGGHAGSLSVSAIVGAFFVGSAQVSSGNSTPTLNGKASLAGNGEGGVFSLDALNLSGSGGSSTTSVSSLESALFAGGFTQSQTLRVRSGNVTVDGTVTSQTFDLSADLGNIEVTAAGNINASGATGGTIALAAGGSVTLDSGAMLSVQGANFNDAGQGGTVTLQSGSYTDASANLPTDGRNSAGLFAGGAAVNINAGSKINLSVINNDALQLNPGGASAATPPGAVTIPGGIAIYFPSGTPGNDEVSFSASGRMVGLNGAITSFTANPQQPYVTAIALGSSVTLASSGTISFSEGSGGSIPLSIPSQIGGAAFNPATVNVTSLSAYNAAGVLNLVAPQVFNSAGNPIDVRIDPILGTIVGASTIVAEGAAVFNLTPTNGSSVMIDGTVEDLVQQNGALFAGGYLLNSNGGAVPTAGNTAKIVAFLTAGSTALSSLLQVRPEAEVVNTTGDLELDATWDFAQSAISTAAGSATVLPFRFGPDDNEPGTLILRAAGNMVLGQNANNGTFGSLSDGFAGFDGSDNQTLMQAKLQPAGSQSWSFELVAGADFSAADPTRVLPVQTLASAQSGASTGSILLGSGSSDLVTYQENDPSDFFETIRTGTGSIGLYAGVDVQLLDNLFSVYTAGTQTTALPNFAYAGGFSQPAQFSSGGGNVSIVAQGAIEHLNAEGQADSSLEIPSNWVDRQGTVNTSIGQFTTISGSSAGDATAWWVDFSNFFEGIGALGGGDVALEAGGSINNVDAAISTNERTAYQTSVATTGTSTVDKLAADQPTLELGGGDLLVEAGQNINGGVYYVERGQGALTAGATIETNATRAAVSPIVINANPNIPKISASWLPTTLFLGDGNFTVLAGGDALLGATVNAFLLPQSSGTGPYFSTYAMAAVSISSLGGTVTLKDDPVFDAGIGGAGSISDWLGQVSATGSTVKTVADNYEPWLALTIPEFLFFETPVSIMPPSLSVTAFNGDIDLAGNFTLEPSARGQLVLDAAGSINGLQPNSVNLNNDQMQWATSVIDLSDANPRDPRRV